MNWRIFGRLEITYGISMDCYGRFFLSVAFGNLAWRWKNELGLVDGPEKACMYSYTQIGNHDTEHIFPGSSCKLCEVCSTMLYLDLRLN